MPILSLDQAGEGRKQRLSLERQSCSLGLSWGMYSLLLHCLGVGSQVQGFSDPVADVGALPGTAWEAKHPWGAGTQLSQPSWDPSALPLHRNHLVQSRRGVTQAVRQLLARGQPCCPRSCGRDKGWECWVLPKNLPFAL